MGWKQEKETSENPDRLSNPDESQSQREKNAPQIPFQCGEGKPTSDTSSDGHTVPSVSQAATLEKQCEWPGSVSTLGQYLASPDFFQHFPEATFVEKLHLQEALVAALKYVNTITGPTVYVGNILFHEYARALEDRGITTVAQLELALQTGSLHGPGMGYVRVRKIRFHLDLYYSGRDLERAGSVSRPRS